MDREQGWVVIEQTRLRLADLLESLSDAEWETPSLCVDWRVRDVAAHMAIVPHHPGVGRMLGGLVKAKGNPDRLNHDLAVAYAEKMGYGLVADLRSHAASRKRAPVTSYDNLFFDTLVHAQDIAVPLSRTLSTPVDAARAGADRVWAMGWPFWAKRKYAKKYRLIADDTEWTAGQGALDIRGPVESLLLLLTGRTAALARLNGDGALALKTEHQATKADG